MTSRYDATGRHGPRWTLASSAATAGAMVVRRLPRGAKGSKGGGFQLEFIGQWVRDGVYKFSYIFISCCHLLILYQYIM